MSLSCLKKESCLQDTGGFQVMFVQQIVIVGVLWLQSGIAQRNRRRIGGIVLGDVRHKLIRIGATDNPRPYTARIPESGESA